MAMKTVCSSLPSEFSRNFRVIWKGKKHKTSLLYIPNALTLGSCSSQVLLQRLLLLSPSQPEPSRHLCMRLWYVSSPVCEAKDAGK